MIVAKEEWVMSMHASVCACARGWVKISFFSQMAFEWCHSSSITVPLSTKHTDVWHQSSTNYVIIYGNLNITTLKMYSSVETIKETKNSTRTHHFSNTKKSFNVFFFLSFCCPCLQHVFCQTIYAWLFCCVLLIFTRSVRLFGHAWGKIVRQSEWARNSIIFSTKSSKFGYFATIYLSCDSTQRHFHNVMYCHFDWYSFISIECCVLVNTKKEFDDDDVKTHNPAQSNLHSMKVRRLLLECFISICFTAKCRFFMPKRFISQYWFSFWSIFQSHEIDPFNDYSLMMRKIRKSIVFWYCEWCVYFCSYKITV